MVRTMTSIVAALVFVFFAGPGLGADVTLTPVTFTSEGAAVQAVLYQPSAGATKQPALVLSPGRSRDIKGIEWLSRALADRGYVLSDPPLEPVTYDDTLR